MKNYNTTMIIILSILVLFLSWENYNTGDRISTLEVKVLGMDSELAIVNVEEKEIITPVYVNQKVDDDSNEILVFVFEDFNLGDNQRLFFKAFELNGDRFLEFYTDGLKFREIKQNDTSLTDLEFITNELIERDFENRFTTGVVQGGVSFILNGVSKYDSLSFFKVNISNRSNIKYDLDFIEISVRNKK